MDRFIQPLESRQLMSMTAPTEPLSPNLISEPVSEYAAVSQKVRIGYLPDLEVGHVSQLHGEISWGDGASSPASFERDPKGGIDVMGTHKYANAGKYSITSQLTETPYTGGGGPVPQYMLNLGDVETTATVAATPPILNETAGKSFTATLGINHNFGLELDIAYSAKIDWGDGNKTVGTVTYKPISSTSFVEEVIITGSHTYPKPGLYKVITRVYSQLAIVGHEGKPMLADEFVTLVRVTLPA